MADRTQIEQIKEKLDIVDVVSRYVPNLKRSSANHFGLCPFHNEKTPSFSVNQEMQIFKCFGCSETGDVIAFIQKIEGLDFPAALKQAADMAGVVLGDEYQNLSPEERKKRESQKAKQQAEREKLLYANKLTSKFFNYILTKHGKGKKARKYCERRKIEKAQIIEFQIGYAPEGYENLKKYLIKKGLKEADLVKWGLLVSKKGRVYDKFRDRLMFPIFDHQGSIVGFSGRQLEKSEYGPKYLNSPETLVYKKKNTLYGLYQAKDAIRKAGFVILVEGNVDILSSARVGVENIVCPLGTALTIEQCKLMRRYASKVYFSLDTDEAGEKALLRGLELVNQAGLEAFALELGEYQDADELIMKDEKLWKKVIENPREIIEFLIQRFAKKYDLEKATEKSKFVSALLPYLKKVQEEIERTEYVKQIALVASVEERLVWQKLGRTADKADIDNTGGKIDKVARGNRLSGKEYLAALLLQNATRVDEDWELQDVFQSWLVELLFEYKDGKDLKSLSLKLDETKRKLVERLSLVKIGEFDEDEFQDEVKKQIVKLLKDELKKERVALQRQLRIAETKGGESDDLIQRIDEITKKLGSFS